MSQSKQNLPNYHRDNTVTSVRDTLPEVEFLTRPEDVRKTLIRLTQEDLPQGHRVAFPRRPTDRADLAPLVPSPVSCVPHTHTFIQG